MKPLYPIMLDVSGRRALVVGGGQVAARKAHSLSAAGACVFMVAPDFCPQARELAGVHREVAKYSANLLAGAELVFACTDDPATNDAIAVDARAAGRWCNVANDPQVGDFQVPALLRRGGLHVAVSTGGQAPALAAAIARRLGSQLDERYGMLVSEVARSRGLVQALPEGRRVEVLDAACGEWSISLLGRDVEAWRAWFEGLCGSA